MFPLSPKKDLKTLYMYTQSLYYLPIGNLFLYRIRRFRCFSLESGTVGKVEDACRQRLGIGSYFECVF